MTTRPPLPGDAVAAALMSFARCFGAGPKGVVYVSTPITTGLAYLEWRAEHPDASPDDPVYVAGHRTGVIETNLDRANAAIERIRSEFPGLVISPTALDDVPGWTQPDYHRFWSEVVVQYAETVIFLDEWQYSTGCAVELAAAVRIDARLLDSQLQDLKPGHALDLLREGIQEVDRAGLDAAAMRGALDSAEQDLTHRPDE